MKRFLGFIAVFSLYLSLASLSFAQTPVNIELKDPAKLSLQAGNIIPFIVNLLFAIGLILALTFMLWGGIRWIMSRGDKTKLDEARSHVIAAIVGLIFVVGAFVFINLTTQILLGKSITDSFKLPTVQTPSPDFFK